MRKYWTYLKTTFAIKRLFVIEFQVQISVYNKSGSKIIKFQVRAVADDNLNVWLTLYHSIPTFNDPKEEGFGKHCVKMGKCW